MEQELFNYVSAYKIYSEWLPKVPEKYPKILSIHYNNYATVLKAFENHKAYENALLLAFEYANKFEDQDSQELQNLINKNLSLLYLNKGKIRLAKEYHSKIDTTNLDEDGKATYQLSVGNIQKAEREYHAALISFKAAIDLSMKAKNKNVLEIASASLLRTAILLERKNHQIKIAKYVGLGILILAILVVLSIPGYLSHKKESIYNRY